MKKSITVEDYVARHPEWQEELKLLREIALSSGMTETVKWGFPVYTIDGKNVVGLAAFKPYVGIWFFQGALLSDPHNRLVNAQEGKTKAMRQWRFKGIEEIEEKPVREYLEEAIRNQKEGREIKAEKNKPLLLSEELKDALDSDPALRDCFAQLSLSKQREFAAYIDEAKQEATRTRRLEKIVPLILEKRGLHDAYRSS